MKCFICKKADAVIGTLPDGRLCQSAICASKECDQKMYEQVTGIKVKQESSAKEENDEVSS